VFAHIFKYRIKCLFGGRAEIFWTLIYPIVLAVFFSMAFSNLSNVGNFEPVEIAVVDNEEYRNDAIFRSALESVSQNEENRYFNVTLTTREDAEERLGNNSIRGYIILENGPRAVVKATGIEQTILTGFLDSYLQTSSAYKSILTQNPEAYGTLQNYDTDKAFVRETNGFKSGADSIVISFFGLISMAAMFGGFRGNVDVENMQANLSPQAARMNLVPVHKLKIFSCALLATILIQFVSLVLLVAFMALV
jgi:ABC-2 type transport system permease protein